MADNLKTSEAQRKASAKWREKNKEKQKRYTYKSQAKKYILDYAGHDDLLFLQELIQQRLTDYDENK